MRFALTREISDRFDECELTHLQRVPIDLDRARAQHANYCELLKEFGCHVITLPGDAALPDCVFVEDPAVVLDDLAVITRPGVVSRRRENEAIEDALAPYRRIERILGPGTLEGGDVIRIDRTLYVGLSTRSNEEGIRQLASLVEPGGYEVRAVPMSGCLHLKSAASVVAPRTLLINRDRVDHDVFESVEFIDVDPAEPGAANCLRIADSILFPAAYPRTRVRLEQVGLAVRSIECDELAKAEAGLTCCSLIFEADWKPRLVE